MKGLYVSYSWTSEKGLNRTSGYGYITIANRRAPRSTEEVQDLVNTILKAEMNLALTDVIPLFWSELNG